MRASGVVLLFLGLVATVVGVFSGCNSLFGWSGRHPIDVRALDEGVVTQSLVPVPGRRYTLSLQVVFDREGLTRKDGIVAFDAQIPIVVRVTDAAGTALAEVTGWLDPNVPPNVVHGQAARESMRASAVPELFVERLVGPFAAASTAPLTVEVNLGSDRVGMARVVARRLVIHDDALPPPIRNAFVAAGAGAAVFIAGVGLVVAGWFKRRRPRRGGNPRPEIV